MVDVGMMDVDDTLAGIDIDEARRRVLLRPPVPTTAEFQGLPDAPVLFDWQQHWERIRPLFDRADVRWAAVQHLTLHPLGPCPFCRESWLKGDAFTAFSLTGQMDGVHEWRPGLDDGCCGKVFPLLLGHDGQDVGSEGSEKAEFALGAMTAEQREALIDEERAQLAPLGNDADFDDEFEIILEYRERCKRWLERELDDARLLCAGLSYGTPGSDDHDCMLPLTFKLAQLLAPPGSQLELRVNPAVAGRTAFETSWRGSVCLDTTNHVAYTLDPEYFHPECRTAQAFLADAPTVVRRWAKDGGIPPLTFAWLRFRQGLPIEIVQLMQTHLLFGRDLLILGPPALGANRHIPAWLGYVDAT
jgi:hypothetical protein